MTEKRVLLDTAAFIDSARALEIANAPTAAIRTIVQRFLAACYEDVGKAPRLLDGEELGTLLREVLPSRFGVRDELADMTEEVLDHYLRFLTEEVVVTHAFEQRRAFDEHIGAFLAAVASGAAHADGVAIRGPGTTIRHQADKVGRNDPCPCGSGRKFKKCCMTLGQ